MIMYIIKDVVEGTLNVEVINKCLVMMSDKTLH